MIFKIMPLIFLLASIFSACSGENPEQSSKTNADNKLRIKGRAMYSLSVGYGDVYNLVVSEKSTPVNMDNTVYLVLIAPNFEGFKEHVSQTFIFEKTKRVESNINPENGFVDNEMNLWKLISVE